MAFDAGGGAVAVIGASCPLGQRVVSRLGAMGADVVVVGRSPARLAGLGSSARIADITDRPAIEAALAGTAGIISCAPGGLAAQVLAAAPASVGRIVFTGSTRRYSRFACPRAAALVAAEAAIAASGRDATMIHPTMILGTEWNAPRVAAFIRRLGVVPLPAGGRSLVQPVHVDDVADCLVAAYRRPEPPWPPVVAAGPRPVSYRAFIEAIARAIGRRVRIIDVPAAMLMAMAPLTRLLPGLPAIDAAEVRRLLEDKAFDPTPMRRTLGVEPIGLDAALAKVFQAG